jgi:hypothetical protein|tara:strand:+ start:42 stop:590 length:549 start_codon:yes stop_codon:yes gene_type:complete
MFNIGDKVKVLNETLEGEIVKIDNDIIHVDCDGFDYPFNETELIKIGENNSIHFKAKQHKFENQSSPTSKSDLKTTQFRMPEFIPKRNKFGVLEVDLHIQAIVHYLGKFKKEESLQIQLDLANKWINWAYMKNERRVVLIHGVGEGILKSALLARYSDSNGISVEDAKYQLYGFGAMELFLK